MITNIDNIIAKIPHIGLNDIPRITAEDIESASRSELSLLAKHYNRLADEVESLSRTTENTLARLERITRERQQEIDRMIAELTPFITTNGK